MSTERPSVIILGMGKLGLPLARRLQQEGERVWGTVRSKESLTNVSDQGLYCRRWSLGEELPFRKHELQDSMVIICVPPGGRAFNKHLWIKLSQDLNDQGKGRPKRVCLVSSTSVYRGMQGNVEEGDCPPQKAYGPCGEIERAFSKHLESLFIVRSGGQLGGGRHPVYYLQRRRNVSDGLAPVNLVWLEDLVNVITLSLNKKMEGIVNVVSGEHPSKLFYYTWSSSQLGVIPATFLAGSSGNKIVVSSRLSELGHVELRSIFLL